MNFKQGLEAISKDIELSGQPTRVLLYILSKTDSKGRAELTQCHIAKVLGVDPARISDAVKKLVNKGIITKIVGKDRSWIYQVNAPYRLETDLKEVTKTC